jgi:hypothetical protein
MSRVQFCRVAYPARAAGLRRSCQEKIARANAELGLGSVSSARKANNNDYIRNPEDLKNLALG